MKTNPDQEFDDFLRQGLAAEPELGPIRDLPQRAIAVAVSRRASIVGAARGRWRSAKQRLSDMATLMAAAAIAGILAVGSWSLVQAAATYGPRDSANAFSTNLGQGDDFGSAALALAVVVIFLGAIMRAVSDALGAESRPMLPAIGRTHA